MSRKTKKEKMNLPNKISVSRILAIPLFVVFLILALDFNYKIARYASAIIFLLISLTDILDGYIARKRNQITEKGKILDPIADKLLMFSAIIFLANRGIPAWIVFVLICREILIVGLRSLMPNKKIFSASKLGKAKTVILTIGIIMVLLELPYSFWVIVFGTFISLISSIDYLLKAKNIIPSI